MDFISFDIDFLLINNMANCEPKDDSVRIARLVVTRNACVDMTMKLSLVGFLPLVQGVPAHLVEPNCKTSQRRSMLEAHCKQDLSLQS